MTSCTSCGGSARHAFTAGDCNRRLSREAFDFYECETCGLMFLHPVPADLGKYYPPDYYDIPGSLQQLATRAEHLQRWKLDLVERHAPAGRLLEVGPAYGLFSYLAKRAGYDVNVIEMDERCRAYLSEVVGVNVLPAGDVVARMRAAAPFDVITLWQVIEHLPDPFAVLDAAAECLAPGGVLVLDTPNPAAFQFRVLRGYWTHVDAPRHVVLIPAKLLVARMEQRGLAVEMLSATGSSSIGFNSFGWAHSLQNFFTAAPLRAVAHFAGRVLTKVLIPIERTGWRGSTYAAVFRKGKE